MDSIRSALLFLAFALAVSSSVSADVLLMDGIQSAPGIQTPRNGITMSRVRQQYGSPVSERPAVGDPPISRWDYDGYSVFFEHDLVLHTVIHHAANN
jgi:hypothetical protein